MPTILDTVCRVTGMGFAAVARVTETEWVACAVRDDIDFGLKPGGNLKLDTTICNEIRHSRQSVIISDTRGDPVYHDHGTPRMYGFRSYISVPIVVGDGSMWGTLCAIDPQPRDLERPEVRNIFQMFAELIGFHLNMADRLDLSEADLDAERTSGIQREQFMAMLGHDLRNPLAAVQAGVGMLRRKPDEQREALILDRMQASVDRMALLIDDILDFARGRLGDGIALDFADCDIVALVEQVVDELAAHHPDRKLVMDGDAQATVSCDPKRVAQLVSNLVGNALTHGSSDEPVIVRCRADEGVLEICVTNAGDEIPAEEQARLFQPFEQGGRSDARQGLGLGLFIASTIAKAHHGALTVNSSPQETCFTFTMPTRLPGA
ncbi:signal transduction histidine kinase [Novosphingobium chloroacetimidivorans]|uniref:histidine kinase n=1 Tax=Novosphingobium chloroacetimidivorans TaxID=1428314 RepID=A0A7W7K891_9SPHN|nr:GAF domain-containing sensor histidine kinase [Novosphingobium chloroacetimidivorans]MBB4858074.1 signal transduction histidine kinase [Novosphingobium chloroacetimidivorans]